MRGKGTRSVEQSSCVILECDIEGETVLNTRVGSMGDVDWDGYAAGWEDEATRGYAAAAFASLQEQCGTLGLSLEGANILDFGCGTGLLVEKLAPLARSVTAIDTSAGMISALRAKLSSLGLNNVQTLCAELTPDLAAGHEALCTPFDVVVCSSVCAFVPDYAATVGLLSRLLRPGGLFAQWDWEWLEADEEPFGLSRATIRTVLQAAGLQVVVVDKAFELQSKGNTFAPVMGIGRVPETETS